MKEHFENNEHMEADNKIPVGWTIFFIAMIVWGVFYLWSYTPELGGWSQHDALVQETQK